MSDVRGPNAVPVPEPTSAPAPDEPAVGHVVRLDAQQDEPLLSAWRELAGASPFGRPEFVCPSAQHLAEGPSVLATVWRRSGLAAALPLVLRGARAEALISEHTPRVDMIGNPDAIDGLWAILCSHLRWRELELRSVPASSPLVAPLERCALRDGFHVAIEGGSCSPYLPLADFETGLSGTFRTTLHAHRERIPELSFERIDQPDERAFEDALELEAAAWAGHAGGAISSDERSRKLYRDWMQGFARHRGFSLAFLRSGSRRIAAHIAFEDERTYYLLRSGYDPTFAADAPAHLLVWEAARDARERGLGEVDFLGPELEWKARWSSLVREHVTVRIYRPTVRGRLSFGLRHHVRPRVGVALRTLPWRPWPSRQRVSRRGASGR